MQEHTPPMLIAAARRFRLAASAKLGLGGSEGSGSKGSGSEGGRSVSWTSKSAVRLESSKYQQKGEEARSYA